MQQNLYSTSILLHHRWLTRTEQEFCFGGWFRDKDEKVDAEKATIRKNETRKAETRTKKRTEI